MRNETLSRAVAPIERYDVDIAEQSVGGADITYGDIYRVTVAASIKGLQLEQNGFDRVDSELVSDLNDFMPLDQDVKDGGQNAIMRARTDAIDKLSHVLNDDEQLDMFLGAIKSDTPLERFVDYISSQTDTPSKTLKFNDVITGSQSVYRAVSLQGSVQIQKSTPQEPAKLVAEQPRSEESDESADPQESINDALRKLIAEEKARRAQAGVDAPEASREQSSKSGNRTKKNRNKQPKEDRDVLYSQIESEMTGFAGTLTEGALKDGKGALIDEQHVYRIEGLDSKILALTLSANLLSCNERDGNKQFTKRDLVTMYAYKITQARKYRYFDITDKKGRGKEQMEQLIDRTLERIDELESDKTKRQQDELLAVV